MPATIPQFFFEISKKYSSRVALRFKQQGHFSGQILWSEWAGKVRLTAAGLSLCGVVKGDRVGILAENSPEWTFADLGALSLGAVTVPLYPTLSADDLAFIIQDSGLKVVFVSTSEQYEKIKSLKINQKQLQMIAFFANPEKPSISLTDLQAKVVTQPNQEKLIEALPAEISKDDLATIIYTSGTTGTPKGVMLTHDNFIENFKGASARIQITERDRALSFLPLSHVFERLAGYYFMAFSGAEIVYAESMLTVADDIRAVQPTVAAAVPRFYEKIYAVIQSKLQSGSGLSRKIFNQAVQFRKTHRESLKLRDKLPLPLKLFDFLYDRIVFSKVRQGVGGRIRFFISGGAPLSRELAEFFDLCGVLILEGYGLTETSPVIAVNTPADLRFGSVGKVLPNVKVKIAEDGEILTSGPCVMKGYWNNPEATREVLEETGWFHTGDIGELSEDGYLKITDRKKDLIVTAGGKKVAPQKLEGLVLRDPLFAQVVALGDKRPYIVALAVLNRALAAEGAALFNLSEKPFETWITDPAFFQWVEARFQKQLEGLARFESVKKIALIPSEFSLQNGELTPTLKIKRRFVMEKYADTINQLYSA